MLSRLSSSIRNPFAAAEQKKAPAGGIGSRLKNIVKNNIRGLVGVIVPLAALTWQLEKFNSPLKLQLIWMWMFWFYLTQPVSIPATGFIPIFAIPMGGIMSTRDTVKNYMNDHVMMYILGSMLVLLLNNSGVDRRIAVYFLCSGNDSQYSPKKLVFKCSMASFFLSMFSSRLITAATITQMLTDGFQKLEGGDKAGEVRNVINNAIQSSSSIGSIAIFHSAYATIVFRGCFSEYAHETQEYPDIFNFLQYSAFAFPVASIMFVFNLLYHTTLVGMAGGNTITESQMAGIKSNLSRNQAELPPISLHEKLSVFFAVLILFAHLFRWCPAWLPGWATFSAVPGFPALARMKDASTCSIFLLTLCILPKGYGFMKVFGAKKKKDLPPLKPESPILWWRFIDKNVNYGYMFTIGSGFTIMKACLHTGLDKILAENIGSHITGKSFNVGLLICVVTASLLSNIMSALAMVTMFLPFVMCMSTDAPVPWPGRVYLAALGVGVAGSLGFCCPFQYTPAYYCHNVGKVPVLKMVKYSIPSVLVCTIILYLALMFYAPILFDPSSVGFSPVDYPGLPTTTPAPPS